jgi:hypothetical protein
MKNFTQVLLFTALIAVFDKQATAQNEKTTDFKPAETDKQSKILQSGKNYDVNFDISNHEAFFLEGEDSLFRYIYANLEIPQAAADVNLVSNALISFKVNFDGKVKDAESISSVGHGIDEQIRRLLEGVEFVPASQGNVAYRSEIVFEIPVKARYLYNIKNNISVSED